MFLNLKFLLFLALVSTQLTFPNHFFYPCDEKQTDRGNFRSWLEGLTLTKNLTCQQPRKIENLIKMTGLRKENNWGFFCSGWSTDYVKHHSQNIRNVQKNQTMKLTRTLFASLLWSDWNCIKTQKLFNGAPASTSWPVMSKSVTLADCRRDIQEQKKGETRIVVPVRIELTALTLSAPRSAHWANGPDKIVKNAEAWYHADGGGYFPPQKAEEDNTLHYLHKFYKYSRFQYFFYYSFKTFPSSHSFYKNFRPVNKTFICPLTVAERVFFRQNGWSCHSAISAWRR